MAEAECMNCGDSFEPEHSRSDHVCDFCNSPKQPIYENEDFIQVVSDGDFPPLKECPKCGSEFYSSDNSAVCIDCFNKV